VRDFFDAGRIPSKIGATFNVSSTERKVLDELI
jgi:hypothetical protein